MSLNPSTCNAPSFEIVHARLGHTSLPKIQHITWCKGHVPSTFSCEVCVMAKMHSLPFNKSTIHTTSPFQLIHMDLWGPYKVANISGAYYFLTIVDDFTRNTWTQLLQNKTQVKTAMIQFYNVIHTQFEIKIKVIRSDNGTEFINDTCLGFFTEKGILHHRSIVKTPQQDGVTERKHRHLLDTDRAIRFHAGFPKNFWGESILSATHIVNTLPMESLGWKSPFEKLYGQPPQYQDLRVIACLCFAANVGVTGKFDSRARKCILLLRVTNFTIWTQKLYFTVEMFCFLKIFFLLK